MNKLLAIYSLLFLINPIGFSFKILSIPDKNPQTINQKINFRSEDLMENIIFSLKKTKTDLSFSLNSKNNNNVNLLTQTKEANCIGYSNYYNAVLKKCLTQNKINNIQIYRARALVYCAGINMHMFSNNPSFRDHDISLIKNLKTNEVYYVDSSLSEVFGDIIVKK
jgi:hypothetical protein